MLPGGETLSEQNFGIPHSITTGNHLGNPSKNNWFKVSYKGIFLSFTFTFFYILSSKYSQGSPEFVQEQDVVNFLTLL